MLTVVHDAREANDKTAGHRSLLDEIVRDGARQMLAAALQAEVAAAGAHHLLLMGAPGAGKTMLAEQLAEGRLMPLAPRLS